MIDSLDGLDIPALPEGVELPGYAESWRASIERAPDARIAVAQDSG
jgi:hypothetical protein